MGVGGDLFVNGESKSESSTSSLRWNEGLSACSDGMKKILNFKAKGFAFADVFFSEGKAGRGMHNASGQRVFVRNGGICDGGGRKRRRGNGRTCGGRRRCDERIDADGQELLAGEVE